MLTYSSLRQPAAVFAIVLSCIWRADAQNIDPSGPAVDRPVLSVVVPFDDGAAQKASAQLCQISRLQNIQVGELMLVGYREQQLQEMAQARAAMHIPENFDPTLSGKEFFKQFRGSSYSAARPGARGRLARSVELKPDATSRLLADLNLEPVNSANAEAVLRHYGITRLPAWIVRFHGRDYVFQGNISPTRLFTADGQFIEGAAATAVEPGRSAGFLSDLESMVVNRDFGETPPGLLRAAAQGRESIFSPQCR